MKKYKIILLTIILLLSHILCIAAGIVVAHLPKKTEPEEHILTEAEEVANFKDVAEAYLYSDLVIYDYRLLYDPDENINGCMLFVSRGDIYYGYMIALKLDGKYHIFVLALGETDSPPFCRDYYNVMSNSINGKIYFITSLHTAVKISDTEFEVFQKSSQTETFPYDKVKEMNRRWQESTIENRRKSEESRAAEAEAAKAAETTTQT